MLPAGVGPGWVTDHQAHPVVSVICLVFYITLDIIKNVVLPFQILAIHCHLLSPFCVINKKKKWMKWSNEHNCHLEVHVVMLCRAGRSGYWSFAIADSVCPCCPAPQRPPVARRASVTQEPLALVFWQLSGWRFGAIVVEWVTAESLLGAEQLAVKLYA